MSRTTDRSERIHVSRQAVLWGAPVLALSTVAGGRLLYDSRHVKVPLYSSTVALGDDEQRFLVPPADDWTTPSSRILRGADEFVELHEQETGWVERSHVPAGLPAGYSEACRLALLDLRVLTLPNGASVAGWSPKWRYVCLASG